MRVNWKAKGPPGSVLVFWEFLVLLALLAAMVAVSVWAVVVAVMEARV